MAEHTGGMIALVPRVDDAARLRVLGGERVDDLHLTLAYLGDDVTGMDPAARNAVVSITASVAANFPMIQARVMGHAVFNPDSYGGREPCVVYLVGDSRLIDDARSTLLTGLPSEVRDMQHAPFIPHITARYGARTLTYTGDVVFDRIMVAFAGERLSFPFSDYSAPIGASPFQQFWDLCTIYGY